MAYDWSKALLNSDFGVGDWSKLGSNTTTSTRGSSMFDPISMGIAAVGQLGSSFLRGQADRAASENLRKSSERQAFYGMLGTMQAANDARAARANANAMNVFGQLSGSLFTAPIDYGLQRRGKEEDLQRFTPMQFAMTRQENRLNEEQDQSPLFRAGKEKDDARSRLAGRYAEALPDMIKYGQFNLPTV
jgi:hypothetical protein